MSSPYRRSSPRSSPSFADRFRHSGSHQPNGVQRPSPSPLGETSSPTRQLLEEFSRVFISDSQAFKRALDVQADEQEKLHCEALAQSLAEHEAVRQSAERARERVEIEIEGERRRRKEEERVKLEESRLRAEREERERRAREEERERQREQEKRTREAEERQREQQRRQDERQQQEQDERLRHEQELRAREDKDRLAKEEAEAKQKAADAIKPAPTTTTTTTQQAHPPSMSAPLPPPTSAVTPTARWQDVQPSPALTPKGITTSANEKEAEHHRYLEMHKRLKEMRKWVLDEAAKHPGMKDQLSEMRRTIKKSLGFVNAVDKKLNVKPTHDIRALFNQAAQMTQVALVPSQFIVAMDAQADSGPGNAPYPGALLYLLNYFAKYIIQRFIDQVARDPKAAEPYGILIVTMFALPTCRYNGHSLIDILWAKFHKVCPVVFGISGSEQTSKGKHRLGWKFDKESADGNTNSGTFITKEEHLSNQVGLGTGFASITLRNFSSSQNKNPAPNHLYWTAVARILSTPPGLRTATHYVVLRSLVERYAPRFVKFYGSAAIAVLRKILRDIPREATDKTDPNVMALEMLPIFLGKEHGLVI